MPYTYLEVTDKLALLFVQHPPTRLPTCHSKTQGETVRFQASLEPTEDRSTLRITKIRVVFSCGERDVRRPLVVVIFMTCRELYFLPYKVKRCLSYWQAVRYGRLSIEHV